VEYIRRSRTDDAMAVAFVYTVEESRSVSGNPAVPPELEESYFLAIRQLPVVALSEIAMPWNEDFLRYIVALVALGNGQAVLATAYQEFTSSEAAQWLEVYYGE
jgi:hypothetical protein